MKQPIGQYTVSLEGNTVKIVPGMTLFQGVPNKEDSYTELDALEARARFDQITRKVAKAEGLNGYKAFYNGKTADIYAKSLIEARGEAIVRFKVKNSQKHMISVVLCEKEGEQVTHSTSSI